VSSGYFQTMGIPIRTGRLFTDDEEQQLVAVASESAARRIWPGEDPIGKRFRHDSEHRWTRVIGVVADARSERLGRDPQATIYVPYFQLGGSDNSLLVRTAVEPGSMGPAIRDRVWKVDRTVPVPQARTMTGIISEALAPRRFQTALVAAFASLGLVLASIGIYGVVSYVVLQRRAEIGIRLALGANQQDISVHILQGGMRPVLVGLGAGIVTAMVVMRLLTTLLFEVRALDPVTFLSAPIVLAIIATLSCYLPARRAGRLNAMQVLRYE
jgi:putative ABC transport system permease protein